MAPCFRHVNKDAPISLNADGTPSGFQDKECGFLHHLELQRNSVRPFGGVDT